MFTFTDCLSSRAAGATGKAAQPEALIEEGSHPTRHRKPKSLPVPTEVGLFQDMPGWIWRAYLSAWATIFGLFLTFFTINAEAKFVVVIAALTGLMAFGLPIALASQSGSGKPQRRTMVDTHTGPLSVGAAAAQIVLIPVGGIVGLTAFIFFAM